VEGLFLAGPDAGAGLPKDQMMCRRQREPRLALPVVGYLYIDFLNMRSIFSLVVAQQSLACWADLRA
jgi:hypothetical protein